MSPCPGGLSQEVWEAALWVAIPRSPLDVSVDWIPLWMPTENEHIGSCSGRQKSPLPPECPLTDCSVTGPRPIRLMKQYARGSPLGYYTSGKPSLDERRLFHGVACGLFRELEGCSFHDCPPVLGYAFGGVQLPDSPMLLQVTL